MPVRRLLGGARAAPAGSIPASHRHAPHCHTSTQHDNGALPRRWISAVVRVGKGTQYRVMTHGPAWPLRRRTTTRDRPLRPLLPAGRRRKRERPDYDSFGAAGELGRGGRRRRRVGRARGDEQVVSGGWLATRLRGCVGSEAPTLSWPCLSESGHALRTFGLPLPTGTTAATSRQPSPLPRPRAAVQSRQDPVLRPSRGSRQLGRALRAPSPHTCAASFSDDR